MPFKIQKEYVDKLLLELAKEFQKQNGRKRNVEMIIVGGGSILINYGFRDYTDDLDYLSRDARALQDASIPVREKYELEYHWINGDFKQTPSYSDKLFQYSSPYRSFNNGAFEVRTVRGEYLIAMKMVSGRRFKTDMSDILGIMICEAKADNHIGLDDIQTAFKALYEEKQVDEKIWHTVSRWCALDVPELEKEYQEVVDHEKFYPEVIHREASKHESGISLASVKDIIKKAYQQENSSKKADVEN